MYDNRVLDISVIVSVNINSELGTTFEGYQTCLYWCVVNDCTYCLCIRFLFTQMIFEEVTKKLDSPKKPLLVDSAGI